MTELQKVALRLAEARQAKKDAEKIIARDTPVYFKLLDEMIGKGQVEFTHDGQRYGRIVAEKASFQIARFQEDYPEIADAVLSSATTWKVDEEALNEYLAANPEQTALIQQYIETIPEARWKTPVAVRDEE